MDNKLKTVDAETLLSTPMSKTMFIADGLISQGVNVISGASKIGKSWLMLWLGLQVAQGNSIWGLPTSPRSLRRRRWRQGLLCRRAATSAAAGVRSVPGRTADFLP